MLSNLSSVSTIFAAPLATSDPAMPIAIPTSAELKLGASLTPSPVMAMKRPRRRKASIMRVLVFGAQRAMTRGNSGMASISASVMLSKSVAFLTIEAATSAGRTPRLRGMIPISLAMAVAVAGWSP